jgi:type IV pilus assembly protein PilQ
VTPISVSDPTKRSAATLHVSNIDFRRGDNGAGRIIMRFDGAGAATDMRNDGKQVVIDVSNASIPENLRRRLDVTDFATPVVSVEPRSNAGGSRLVVNTNGAYESMAYQTGNEYVVEIAPKRGAVVAGARMGQVPANAGQITIGGTGRYVGKPVTFNFQDVPVRTVLQLIAEESGLNIVVADTVGGSVTLRLINVPWDQALEIVLRAKGLDQRRDGNVVWVAPQAELSAYELAQANSRIALENAGELVVEYIPINYGSAIDLVQIIQGNGGGAGGGGGGGGGGAGQQRGLLSAARHGQRRRAYEHAAGSATRARRSTSQEDAAGARPAGGPGPDRGAHRDRRRHLLARTRRPPGQSATRTSTRTRSRTSAATSRPTPPRSTRSSTRCRIRPARRFRKSPRASSPTWA